MPPLTKKQQAKAKEILQPYQPYIPQEHTNFHNFLHVPIHVLETLIKEQLLDPEETQNNSPTAQEMINALKIGHQKGTAHGYLITERHDARITLEGIETTTYDPETLSSLITTLRYADTLHLQPTEEGPQNNHDHFTLYCWWD